MTILQRFTAALASAVAMTYLVLVPTAAHAEPVPAEQRLSASPIGYSYDEDGYTGFSVHVSGPEGWQSWGVQPVLKTYDCQGQLLSGFSFPDVLTSESMGEVHVTYGFNGPRLGPISWTLDMTHPGFDSYQLTGSANPQNVPCWNPGDDDIVISKKSVKLSGRAVVGKKLRISATETNADEVSYSWMAGRYKRYGGYKKSMKFGKAYKGLPITVLVVLRKGRNEETYRVRFGKLRVR